MTDLFKTLIFRALVGPIPLTRSNTHLAGDGPGVVVLGRKDGTVLYITEGSRLVHTLRSLRAGARQHPTYRDADLVVWYVREGEASLRREWIVALTGLCQPLESRWPAVTITPRFWIPYATRPLIYMGVMGIAIVALLVHGLHTYGGVPLGTTILIVLGVVVVANVVSGAVLFPAWRSMRKWLPRPPKVVGEKG